VNEGGALLYFGKVMHRRLAPVRHGFRYGVFYLRLRVDRMPRRWPRLFAHNGWNLFSFHDADHGPRDGSALLPWIRSILTRHGLACADGAIWLQAFPRVLGYVFNPVSFWLCHDRAGALRAVLAEVRNTFGEHHNYLVAHPDGRAIMPGDWLTARKVFHVSPFFPVSGHYRFRFNDAGAHCNFRIDYTADDGAQLLTGVGGTAQTLRSPALAWAFFRYPWMTLGVILRIHYQALRLWLKRVPFHSKPQPPFEEIT
jgi:DUF1365 family protein